MTSLLNLLSLSLRQRNILRRTAAHQILNLHRIGGNADHFVPPVHYFALTRYKNVIIQREKNLLRFARPAGKAEKFQRNRRRHWRRWRMPCCFFFLLDVSHSRPAWCRNHNIRLRHKNISSAAFVQSFFAAGQQIQFQRRIQILHSDFLVLPGTRRRLGCWNGCSRLRARSSLRRPHEHGNEHVRAEQQGQHTQNDGPRRLLLIVESQLHYDPAFKYVSSFTFSFTGPCGWPPRVTLLMMKNISSRSSALMNFASEV